MAREAVFCLLAMVFVSSNVASGSNDFSGSFLSGAACTTAVDVYDISLNTDPQKTYDYQTKLKAMYCHFEKEHHKEILPQNATEEPLTVSMDLSLGNIDDFDEISGVLTLTLAVDYEWVDGRLTWDKYANLNEIKSLTISTSFTWSPYVYVKESAGKITPLADDNMRGRVYSDGRVAFKVLTVISVKCDVDVTYYPFDEQLCDIHMLPWGYENTEVVLTPRQEYLDTKLTGDDSIWEVLPSKIKSQTFQKHSEVKLSLHLKRRNTFHIVFVIWPLILFAIVNKFVFLLPQSSGERCGVAVTMFLAFNVYMLLANDILPASSQPLAKLYYYLLYLLIYSAVIMIMVFISLRIYSKAEHKENEPEPRVTPCIAAIATLIAKLTSPITRLCYRDTASTGKGAPDQPNEEDHMTDGRNEKNQITWIDVGKAFDKICFFLLLIVNIFVFIGFISSVSNLDPLDDK